MRSDQHALESDAALAELEYDRCPREMLRCCVQIAVTSSFPARPGIDHSVWTILPGQVDKTRVVLTGHYVSTRNGHGAILPGVSVLILALLRKSRCSGSEKPSP